MKPEFARLSFSKNTQISNFMKIRPVRAEVFHGDRRKDMTKLIIAFRNFSNEPQRGKDYSLERPVM
jgi:hypothetical protein